MTMKDLTTFNVIKNYLLTTTPLRICMNGDDNGKPVHSLSRYKTKMMAYLLFYDHLCVDDRVSNM